MGHNGGTNSSIVLIFIGNGHRGLDGEVFAFNNFNTIRMVLMESLVEMHKVDSQEVLLYCVYKETI
jgi:hypothetical protein